jgi:putative transposase
LILKQAENDVLIPELCREHGMSSAGFYKWPAKFGGMEASMMARLKELEDESRRLKTRTLTNASRLRSVRKRLRES